MSPTIYERERLLVDPLSAVAALTDHPPTCERHAAGCRYVVVIRDRKYTGRGVTEREAAWALLASIAKRQAEVCSCL